MILIFFSGEPCTRSVAQDRLDRSCRCGACTSIRLSIYRTIYRSNYLELEIKTPHRISITITHTSREYGTHHLHEQAPQAWSVPVGVVWAVGRSIAVRRAMNVSSYVIRGGRDHIRKVNEVSA